jgi:hypothetical protein
MNVKRSRLCINKLVSFLLTLSGAQQSIDVVDAAGQGIMCVSAAAVLLLTWLWSRCCTTHCSASAEGDC